MNSIHFIVFKTTQNVIYLIYFIQLIIQYNLQLIEDDHMFNYIFIQNLKNFVSNILNRYKLNLDFQYLNLILFINYF